MKSSERRMSAGWSFAVGMLFGALAVFGLLASLGIPGLKAEGSRQQRHLAVAAARHADAPETLASPEMHESDSGRSAPAFPEKGAQSSADAPHRVPGHSELDLQLD